MRTTRYLRLLVALAACAVMASCASVALAAPTTPTVAATLSEDIGVRIATLRAEINPGGADTSYRFEYGQTAAYGIVVPLGGADIGSGLANVDVQAHLSGLSPNTVYHYRVVAANTQGEVSSEDKIFSTFGVASFEASAINADGTLDVEAGSHPGEIETNLKFSQIEIKGEKVLQGALKDLELSLPVGLAGDPAGIPQCPQSLLPSANGSIGLSQCPADTQIGLLTLELPEGLKLVVPLYNLVPVPGVPAQFGVYALLFPLTMTATVRADRNYALGIDMSNVSTALPLTSIGVTLWGVPASASHDSQRGECVGLFGEDKKETCPSAAPLTPLLTMPTVCDGAPPKFTMYTTSWAQPEEVLNTVGTNLSGLEDQQELFGCEKLDFAPSLKVQPDTFSADSPAGFDIELGMPYLQNALGKAESSLRDVKVTLPPGMSINVAAADGLTACTQAQIGLGTVTPSSCPASSAIGDVEIDTPQLPVPLVGSMYLATQGDNPFGSDFAAYIVAQADGVLVKLAMQVVPDPSTGQLTVLMNRVPQVQFTEMKLDFRGGARSILATPGACGSYTATGGLTPYALPSVQTTLTSGFAISTNCGGGFSPSFAAGATSVGPGEGTDFTLQVGRTDGQQEIHSLSASLPDGLLAKLGGVPRCATSEAAAGTCAASSRIGTATIAAGAGSHPFYLSGGVFLTGPYEGAPFGLSIIVPAIAGPFDLGTVAIRARLSIGRRDARLGIATDQIPSILKGVLLRVRAITVNVDRPGFMSNPTSCAPQGVAAEVEGSRTTARVSSPFALAGCEHLAFAPTVSASTRAKVSQGAGAAFNLRIGEAGAARANIKSIQAIFPSRLAPRLKTIQRACLRATFVNNPALCPKGSRVGSAEAHTSLLGTAMRGPAYLVSNGTTALAELAIVLQGEGVTLELSGSLKLSGEGTSEVRFKSLPDASISSLNVSLPAGPYSMLGASTLNKPEGSLCGRRLVLKTTITGQNGLSSKHAQALSVNGCRKKRRR